MENMTLCLSKDKSRNFFKEIKRMYPKSTVSPCINSLTDPQDIAECLARKYEAVYNKSVPKMDFIEKSIENGINCDDINTINDALTFQSVKKAVDSLNAEKSDGDKGYNSCHLIYASDLFYEQLCHLLRAVYVHGHQPEALLLATIISITKDSKGKMCSDSNYRGIALCCSMSKVLDRFFSLEKLKETSDFKYEVCLQGKIEYFNVHTYG